MKIDPSPMTPDLRISRRRQHESMLEMETVGDLSSPRNIRKAEDHYRWNTLEIS